jgi:MFS transporter, SP family, general alpha glucoside:H+ symporter
VGIALLLFGFFNSLGVASAVPVISSEISTVRLRSKSQGIGLTVQCLGAWVFSFFTPYLYNVDQANWGGKIGFFFAGLSTIAFAVTWLDVPETMWRTFAELDVLFEDKVPARKFKYTQVASPEAEPTDGAKTGAQMF